MNPVSSRLDDPGRLFALDETGLLDALPPASLDRVTRLAALSLGTPVALLSLVDARRQYFASQVGLSGHWATERQTPLSHSFCRHVVERGEQLVVDDARSHPLVSANPAIEELGVIAYAGKPIRTHDNLLLGSFCAIDSKPRRWSERELQILGDLADAVTTEIDLRRNSARLERSESQLADVNVRLANALDTGRTSRAQTIHDLRSPLSVITMSTAYLLRHAGIGGFAEVTTALRRIERNTEHVLAMVKHLGPAAAAPEGAQHCDLSSLARQIVEDFQAPAPRLEFEAAPGSVEVRGAPTEVHRCIENLVANARRFARRLVRVRIEVSERSATLSVDDDGPGLPDDASYRQAWEPGTRYHAEQGLSGTGLGLAIVCDLVDRCGGSVDAGRSRLGGASFRFTLSRV